MLRFVFVKQGGVSRLRTTSALQDDGSSRTVLGRLPNLHHVTNWASQTKQMRLFITHGEADLTIYPKRTLRSKPENASAINTLGSHAMERILGSYPGRQHLTQTC